MKHLLGAGEDHCTGRSRHGYVCAWVAANTTRSLAVTTSYHEWIKALAKIALHKCHHKAQSDAA